MRAVYSLKGLTCANCAGKIEENLAQMEGVREANMDLMGQRVLLHQEEDQDLTRQIQLICDEIEPGLAVMPQAPGGASSSSQTGTCACDHDHGDDHGHDHDHVHDYSSQEFIQVGLAVVLAALVNFLLEGQAQTLAFGGVLLFAGFPVYRQAVRRIMAKDFFDENFLMTLATLAAFYTGEYVEAIAVMAFYRVGEAFQGLAMDRSSDSIQDLLKQDVDIAHLLRDGAQEDIDPQTLQVGDQIVVYPGDTIPIDGHIISGQSFVNNAAMTGEATPIRAEEGDEVMAGAINEEGALTVQVDRVMANSAMAKVKRLVQESSMQKSQVERWITRFSKVYTPIVVAIAAVVAFVLPLITQTPLNPWIYRAAIFLIISCPCALVLSVPLSMFAGIGRASNDGVFVRGGDRLEKVTEIDVLAFDKTGTLTDGVFKLEDVEVFSSDRARILSLAKTAEQYSNHPIAQAIMEEDGDPLPTSEHKEKAGKGILAQLDSGHVLAVGNLKLMEEEGVQVPEETSRKTQVYVALDGQALARITLADSIKPGVKEALARLREDGVETVLLSGDNDGLVQEVAQELGIDRAYGSLFPQDKLDLVSQAIDQGRHVAFAGDGINDAPVLQRSDVAIGMGGSGSDLAIESSDIVLLNDDISKIPFLFDLAQQTKKITHLNIGIALGVKILVMVLGLFGLASMWMAVFADVGVSLICVLVAMSLIKWRK